MYRTIADQPAKTYYTRPRRRRWKQLVRTSWLSAGAIKDGCRRRLNAATGREVQGQEYYTPTCDCSVPFVKIEISH
jgi:hypothetical protein